VVVAAIETSFRVSVGVAAPQRRYSSEQATEIVRPPVRAKFVSVRRGELRDVTYRWVEHTSELELEIAAATEPAVFLEALNAFAELVTDVPSVHSERREVEVRGDDRESLLVAWLEELVFLAEREGFVPERAAELELGDGVVRATLRGHSGAPRPLVKAVTLHRLLFTANGEGWRARVVLDV
jgi:protein archease